MDRKGPSTSFTSQKQSAPAAAFPDVESSPQVRDHIRQIGAEEVTQKHAKLLQKASQHTAKDDFKNIFFTGCTVAEE